MKIFCKIKKESFFPIGKKNLLFFAMQQGCSAKPLLFLTFIQNALTGVTTKENFHQHNQKMIMIA